MLPRGFYKGTVKFFDSREEKRFGFIRVEGSDEEIFFHFNDGRPIEVRNDQVQFSESATVVYQGKPRRLRAPKPDDVLVFMRSSGARGYKAAPWSYHDSLERCEQWISDHRDEITARQEAKRQALANRPVYRVLEQMTPTGGKPGEVKTLWQGQDLEEVKRRFPVPSGRMSPSADPLLSYWADTDNIFSVRRWWEKQKPDGSWENCEDQRSLSGVLRTFETINWR